MTSIRVLMAGTLAAALALVLLATPALAREGLYLGGGFADQFVSGGLDGKKNFTDSTQTLDLLAGKPTGGRGFDILGGYGFNKVLAVELAYTSTTHKATHSGVNFDSNMDLDTLLFSVKAGGQATDNLEIYGRVSFASATATYDKYTLHGTTSGGTFFYTSTSEAKFSGGGYGVGGGLEYMLGNVGLSANFSVLSIDFDEAEGGGVSGKLPTTLSSVISQVFVNAAYYFN